MRSIAVAVLAASCIAAAPQKFGPDNLAPYIPTPQILVDAMLQYADVKAGDVVYDLGSGDGRIVITAAEKFGAHGVGVELDAELCRTAQRQVVAKGLATRVSILQENALTVDISPATVVTMYLMTSSNERLRPNLEKYLRPGSRVVTTDYPMKGWTATKLKIVKTGSAEHRIYVYEIGHTK